MKKGVKHDRRMKKKEKKEKEEKENGVAWQGGVVGGIKRRIEKNFAYHERERW